MKLYTSILAIVISFGSFGQLLTFEAAPQFLVGPNFLGPNYSVSNVQYTGFSFAKGQFDGSNTMLGMDNGIILTTGSIIDTLDAPFGPNDQSSAGMSNNFPGYPLLENINGGVDTYNAAVLEFDFVPSVDSLSINYIFGSDEYPEYIGSTFNDAFGFFLSGPGIVGYNNIAVTPLGETVSVNNVHNGNSNTGPCVQCAYYLFNGTGNDSPYDTSSIYVQYDGLVVGLTARAEDLQVGMTYHLIIAIADSGDEIYDSGLFIESCSDCQYMVDINNINQSDLNIYPNPISQYEKVKISGLVEEQYIIYNAQGSVVQTGKYHKGIELYNLNSGYYLIKLVHKNSPLSIPLVIK